MTIIFCTKKSYLGVGCVLGVFAFVVAMFVAGCGETSGRSSNTSGADEGVSDASVVDNTPDAAYISKEAGLIDSALVSSEQPGSAADARADVTAADASAIADSTMHIADATVDDASYADATVDDASYADATVDDASQPDMRPEPVFGSDDFRALEDSDTLPTGWDLIWDDGGQTPNVGIFHHALESDVAFLGIQSSELVSLPESPSSAYYQLAAARQEFAAEDIEVLFLTGVYTLNFRFALRIQGEKHLGHGAYVVSVDRDANNGKIHLNCVYNSGYTSTGERHYEDLAGSLWLANSNFTKCSENKIRYWVRFRVEGSDLKAKIWCNGASEPESWTIEGSNSDITGPGTFGPVTYTNFTTRIERIAWATGGATAEF